MSESKQCSKCSQVKPLEAFGKHATAHDRLQPWCRQCQSANRRGKPLKPRTDATVSPSVANGYNPPAPAAFIPAHTMTSAPTFLQGTPPTFPPSEQSGPALTRREAEICFTAVARAAIKPDAPDVLALLRKLDAMLDAPTAEPVPIRPATFHLARQTG